MGFNPPTSDTYGIPKPGARIANADGTISRDWWRFLNALAGNLGENPVGGNYTLSQIDNRSVVYLNGTSAQTVTIPFQDTTIAVQPSTLGQVFICNICNIGTNSATIQGASGVTLQLGGANTPGNRTLAQNGMMTLFKVDTNTWIATGMGLT